MINAPSLHASEPQRVCRRARWGFSPSVDKPAGVPKMVPPAVGIEALKPSEWVALVRQGGPDGAKAEALLCGALRDRIRAYGLRHLRNRDLIDDFVQHVTLELLVAARSGRIEDEERVERFALGICRNTNLSSLRDSKKQRDMGVQSAFLQQAFAPTAPDLAELAELTLCLSTLDARARDVLVYSFKLGLDAGEIADKLCLSPGNVRVVRHRALARLRDCLQGVATS